MERKIIVNGEVKEFDNIVAELAEDLPLNGVVSHPVLAMQALIEPATWDELEVAEAAFDLTDAFRASDELANRIILSVPIAQGLYVIAKYFPYGKERQLRTTKYWLYINATIYLRNGNTEGLARLAVAAHTLPMQVELYRSREVKEIIHNAIKAYKTGKPVV